MRAQFSRDESRILTWSEDDTARIWLLNVDLDFPAEPIQLALQAVTASEFDFITRQVKPLSPDAWRQIRQDYEKVAADHAKQCKYPEFNHWLRGQKNSH